MKKISKFIFREYLIKVISVQTGWKYAKVILKKEPMTSLRPRKRKYQIFTRHASSVTRHT